MAKYQPPQTKNSRNIIADNRVRTSGGCVDCIRGSMEKVKGWPWDGLL